MFIIKLGGEVGRDSFVEHCVSGMKDVNVDISRPPHSVSDGFSNRWTEPRVSVQVSKGVTKECVRSVGGDSNDFVRESSVFVFDELSRRFHRDGPIIGSYSISNVVPFSIELDASSRGEEEFGRGRSTDKEIVVQVEESIRCES